MLSFFRLLVWANIWFIIWLVFTPFRKGRQNCLTYAIEKWDKEDGYLVLRWAKNSKSKLSQWPHFLWLDGKHHVHLEHIDSDDNNEKRIIPKCWFEPNVIYGDPKDSN